MKSMSQLTISQGAAATTASKKTKLIPVETMLSQ
jgi:hypothetical protein